MSVSRECPYLGSKCPYLGWCPYLGCQSYEAYLIIKNRFLSENLFGSTTTLGKVVFGHHFGYLIVISNYSFKISKFPIYGHACPR